MMIRQWLLVFHPRVLLLVPYSSIIYTLFLTASYRSNDGCGEEGEEKSQKGGTKSPGRQKRFVRTISSLTFGRG